MRFVLLAAALVACAGQEAGTSPAVSASLQSGVSATCAGLDEPACTAKSACFWYVDTMACPAGCSRSPDHCVDRAQGPVDPRMECFCAGANTSAPYACVRDTGSTAIACQPVPAGCSARMNGIDAQTAGVCACLSGAGRSCRAANDIRNLCDCGAPPPAQPCQPAAGPASFLAGKWHAPVSPSDFSMDLMLEGGPAGICGSSTSTFPGTDAGGGPSAIISGTEQMLRFDYSTGAQGQVNVTSQDATHVFIGSQLFVRQSP